MGGDEPARTLTAAALGAGKPVVSANKHVVAHHGPELEALARRSGAAFRFEAAVAGGTPVLGPLAAELAADRVDRDPRDRQRDHEPHPDRHGPRRARLCATSSPMPRRPATRRPTRRGDVEGDDAVNKLAILARLAFGTWLDPATIERRPPAVARRGCPGITGVDAEELRAAAAVGLTIKLLAGARRADDSIVAGVLPTAVPIDSPLGRTGRRREPGRDRRRTARAASRSSARAPAGRPRAAPSSATSWPSPGRGPTARGPACRPPPARSRPGPTRNPRRRFFASSLPEQLVRDQVEIEVAKGGGFIAAAVPLEELRAGLAAAGVAATLYPIDA